MSLMRNHRKSSDFCHFFFSLNRVKCAGVEVEENFALIFFKPILNLQVMLKCKVIDSYIVHVMYVHHLREFDLLFDTLADCTNKRNKNIKWTMECTANSSSLPSAMR